LRLSDQPLMRSEEQMSEEQVKAEEERLRIELLKVEEGYKDILNVVIGGIGKVLEAKAGGLIKQKGVAEKFIRELKENQDLVMEAFLFSVKPSFRDVYMDAVDRIVEVVEGE